MPVLLMAGCAQHGDNSLANSERTTSGGVLAAMRPGADPALVDRLNQEERLRAQQAAAMQGQAMGQPGTNAINALMIDRGALPKVSTDPIAPPAEQVADAVAIDTHANDQEAIVTPANSPNPASITQPVTYAPNYMGAGVPPPPPMGQAAAGLVPPPLPVTLSTQVQTYAGSVADAGFNPYANPYYNPYGIPVPYPQAQAQAPERPRPAGLFGEGGRASGGDDASADSAKRKAAFVPISPTGMKSRSPFQQKDDLKVLFKGAIAQAANAGALAGDPKLLNQLGHIDVEVPSEASKGNFNVSARQIDTIFRSQGVDKRSAGEVRKLEGELAQNYYRYLYTYNKHCLAQQTVAARKQELEVADSPAEQQRAAADLSQAQTDAEAAKDDLHSAQFELAQASSPSAARAIIAKVSGMTPSIESLASSETRAKASNNKVAMFGNVFNPLGGMFKFGHGKPEGKEKADAANAPQANSAEQTAYVPEKHGVQKADKSKRNKKDKAGAVDSSVPDLSPAPEPGEQEISGSTPVSAPVSEKAAPAVESTHQARPVGISFTLKGVDVTARKSVLTVAIKNGGANSFDFNPDSISIAEGSHRLSDATTRADFDATSVQPNEEVKGTITIFGRPWSDKLTVCLSGGNRTIALKR
jgi:hypothetical protein